MLKKISFIAMIIFLFIAVNNSLAQPKGFVYLKDIEPTIIQDLRYPTYDNYIGRPVAGYTSSQCILTKRAALALAQLQKKLKTYNLGLKVFDCYRPKSAVN